MFNWCIETRHYSEDVAAKRIRAIRAVRRFPIILDMIADGRLHLSAVALLACRLTHENADELLTASVHRSKRSIERMLAERFPEADAPTLVQIISSANFLPAPGPVKFSPLPGSDGIGALTTDAPAASPDSTQIAGPVAASPRTQPQVLTPPHTLYSSVAPIAPERYKVRFTMDAGMYADLCRAQELLGPGTSDDRVREVFRRALQALVAKLEAQKRAATSKPNSQRKPSKTRHVPAAVKRQVSQRDGDRCTFVAENGRRCESREALEFDHVLPVALGGRSTLENLRLLCRAHNQYEAECVLGAGFMHGIRDRRARCS